MPYRSQALQARLDGLGRILCFLLEQICIRVSVEKNMYGLCFVFGLRYYWKYVCFFLYVCIAIKWKIYIELEKEIWTLTLISWNEGTLVIFVVHIIMFTNTCQRKYSQELIFNVQLAFLLLNTNIKPFFPSRPYFPVFFDRGLKNNKTSYLYFVFRHNLTYKYSFFALEKCFSRITYQPGNQVNYSDKFFPAEHDYRSHFFLSSPAFPKL